MTLRFRWMQRMLPLAALVSLIGCDPPPTSIPPGQAAPVAPPAPERPVQEPAPPREPAPIDGTMDAGAAAVPPAGGGTAAAPAPKPGAVGDACDSAADCETGICEGEGCAPGKGRCAAKNRMCTRDRRAYCGCDGNTFYSSGSCPGARFSARAACAGGAGGAGGAGSSAKAADGSACTAAADCQSGICEGEGCTDARPGACASRKRPCTADLRPYCGCDGATFRSSSSCPGRRYASRGECKK